MQHPELKHFWRFSANLQTIEEMKRSDQLGSHGKTVFEAINAAVNSLNNVDLLNVLLVELGTRHSSYGAKIVIPQFIFYQLYLFFVFSAFNLLFFSTF